MVNEMFYVLKRNLSVMNKSKIVALLIHSDYCNAMYFVSIIIKMSVHFRERFGHPKPYHLQTYPPYHWRTLDPLDRLLGARSFRALNFGPQETTFHESVLNLMNARICAY